MSVPETYSSEFEMDLKPITVVGFGENDENDLSSKLLVTNITVREKFFTLIFLNGKCQNTGIPPNWHRVGSSLCSLGTFVPIRSK